MKTKPEVKHTPGPWSVMFHNSGNIGSRDVCEIWADKIGSVALAKRIVHRAVGANPKIERPLAEARANAHLIAAAPDLLEACKIALDDNRKQADGSLKVQKILLSAIAKSGGHG
ncbi:MAG: hypothetical protein KW806_02965 [Candidatus Yanofskybacteria bacterium]|nr:hypothetical protein [Candidatus Yanofskybacteria bacterium]